MRLSELIELLKDTQEMDGDLRTDVSGIHIRQDGDARIVKLIGRAQ